VCAARHVGGERPMDISSTLPFQQQKMPPGVHYTNGYLTI